MKTVFRPAASNSLIFCALFFNAGIKSGFILSPGKENETQWDRREILRSASTSTKERETRTLSPNPPLPSSKCKAFHAGAELRGRFRTRKTETEDKRHVRTMLIATYISRYCQLKNGLTGGRLAHGTKKYAQIRAGKLYVVGWPQKKCRRQKPDRCENIWTPLGRKCCPDYSWGCSESYHVMALVFNGSICAMASKKDAQDCAI